MGNRVLALGAHPDDVEFMCSGTLKLLGEKGYEIAIGVVANGDCGSMEHDAAAITRIRREEAMEAARLLGADYHQVGEKDLRVYFDDKTLMKVTELLRTVSPDIVFTHAHEDYMTDHEAVSRLARMACFAALIPNYTTGSKNPASVISRRPWLYYWAPLDGMSIYGDFVPQRIHVNVTDVIDFKCAMLACHRSQRDWLLEQHGMDQYTETMKATAELYGKLCGFKYAEGFVQHRGNAYPEDDVLKEILGDLVIEK